MKGGHLLQTTTPVKMLDWPINKRRCRQNPPLGRKCVNDIYWWFDVRRALRNAPNLRKRLCRPGRQIRCYNSPHRRSNNNNSQRRLLTKVASSSSKLGSRWWRAKVWTTAAAAGRLLVRPEEEDRRRKVCAGRPAIATAGHQSTTKSCWPRRSSKYWRDSATICPASVSPSRRTVAFSKTKRSRRSIATPITPIATVISSSTWAVRTATSIRCSAISCRPGRHRSDWKNWTWCSTSASGS